MVPAPAAGAFLQRVAQDSQLAAQLNGVLLQHSDAFPGWNPDSQTPLAEYVLHAADRGHVWNGPGVDVLKTAFPFPVFQLDNVSSPIAQQRATYNSDTRVSQIM